MYDTRCQSVKESHEKRAKKIVRDCTTLNIEAVNIHAGIACVRREMWSGE